MHNQQVDFDNLIYNDQVAIKKGYLIKVNIYSAIHNKFILCVILVQHI